MALLDTLRTAGLTAGCGVVTAIIVTRLSIPFMSRIQALDVPNERSSHEVPTPRGGGLGVLAALAMVFVLAWVQGLPVPSPWILAAGAVVAAVGITDDISGGMRASVRLLAQAGAAGLVLYGCGPIRTLPLPAPLNVPVGSAGYALGAVWIVGVINLYNFLDGIDGYAGTQGILGAVTILLCGLGGATSTVTLAITAGCLGFLVWNWHPAKIFMGDAGSTTLGFLFATLVFEVSPEARGDAALFVGIALWMFLADGAFTIGRRLVRGEQIWTPHRTHLYQRLVITGWPHHQVVLAFGFGMVIAGAAAVAAARTARADVAWGALALMVLTMTIYAVWIQRRELHRCSRSTKKQRAGG